MIADSSAFLTPAETDRRTRVALAAQGQDLPPDPPADREVKQVIVIRRDLGMRRGKEIAQGAHASMRWLADRMRITQAIGHTQTWHSALILSEPEMKWLAGLFTKVVCQVPSEHDLLELLDLARMKDIMAYDVTDAGRTEFSGRPTLTAVAIGPDYSDVIDLVTGKLQLY